MHSFSCGDFPGLALLQTIRKINLEEKDEG
jgi:hypothetical protein